MIFLDMSSKKALALALLFAPLLSPAAPLSAFEIETALGYSQIYPDGDLNYKGFTKLDLQNDLGYDKIDVFHLRVKAELPLILPNVYAQATPMRLTGTSTVGKPFQFGDQVFTANMPFTSKLNLDHYDFALFYNIPFVKTLTRDRVDAELGLNLRLIDFKGEVIQANANLSQSKKLIIPVPMGYASLQIKPIDELSIDGELRAIAYAHSRYLDATGRVKYLFFDLVFLAAGYRFENIKIDQSDIHSDLRFGGPLVELGVDF